MSDSNVALLMGALVVCLVASLTVGGLRYDEGFRAGQVSILKPELVK